MKNDIDGKALYIYLKPVRVSVRERDDCPIKWTIPLVEYQHRG